MIFKVKIELPWTELEHVHVPYAINGNSLDFEVRLDVVFADLCEVTDASDIDLDSLGSLVPA